MDIIEFLSLPVKEIDKYVTNRGINHHRDLEYGDYDNFCTKLGIEKSDDCNVIQWFSISRGWDSTMIYLTINYKGMPFPFEIRMTYPCKIRWQIDGNDVYNIYKRVSDFYDTRPDYNNLEFDLYAYHSFLSKAKKLNLKEYLEKLKEKYDKLIKICEEVGELYDNGTVEWIANKFLKIPFDRGNKAFYPRGPLTPFNWMVCGVYNITEKFGENSLTIEELLKIWYCNEELRGTVDDKDSLDITMLFGPEMIFSERKVNVTLKKLKHYASSVDMVSDKPTFAEYLYKAHREWYEKITSEKSKIAKKYKIDEEMLKIMFYDGLDAKYFEQVEVPLKFANDYR